MKILAITLFGLALFTSSCATEHDGMSTKYDTIFNKHSKNFNLPEGTLKLMAFYESGIDANATEVYPNGDVTKGLFLISEKYFPEIKQDGYNPDINTKVAANILSNCIKKYGKTTQAIKCFDKFTDAQIESIFASMNK